MRRCVAPRTLRLYQLREVTHCLSYSGDVVGSVPDGFIPARGDWGANRENLIHAPCVVRPRAQMTLNTFRWERFNGVVDGYPTGGSEKPLKIHQEYR